MKKFVNVDATASIAEVKRSANGEDFLIILTDDLTHINKDLVDTKGNPYNVLTVGEAWIDLIKTNENIATVGEVLSVLSQQGNEIAFNVERTVVGEIIFDNEGKPVIGADGLPRTYQGRIDGSSAKGDILLKVTDIIPILGENAKKRIDATRQQVEIQLAVLDAQKYVSMRAKTPKRVRTMTAWEDPNADQNTTNPNPNAEKEKELTPANVIGGTAKTEKQ